jgi:hypothetical protein
MAQRSLDPGRDVAPSASELVASLAGRLAPVGGDEAFARVLDGVAQAFAEDFPDNLFLDLELLASALARAPSALAMERLGDRVRGLSHEFGAPPIHFRYAHDFLYGFDWCRWVARDPAARAGVGPFDEPFLAYLATRAGELRALIAKDDPKYGRIGSDTFRNPFGFSREPEDEERLHRALAARDLIPVEAWRVDGRARWDRPYAQLREDVARELGVAHRSGG